MKLVKKMLADLRRPDRNVRLHTDRQLKELRRSVEMFGQIRPIVVDENNVMLAGNGLYEALLSMEWTEVDCHVVTGLSEKQKKKLMLADNKVYTLGSDDMEAFDAILAELEGDNDIPGFDPQLIETLMASMPDVDEMLTDYGTFDSTSRASMQTAAERSTMPPAPSRDADIAIQHAPESPAGISSTTPVAPYQSPQGGVSVTESTEAPCIVCPHCGARILLGGDM